MYLLFFLIRGRECYGRGLGLFLYLLFWSLVCVSCDAMCCYGDVTSHPGLVRKALITNALQLETFSLTERDSHREQPHTECSQSEEHSHGHRVRRPVVTAFLYLEPRVLSPHQKTELSSEPSELSAHGSKACCSGPSRRGDVRVDGPRRTTNLKSQVSLAHTRFYVHSRLQGLFTFFLYVMLYGG